MADATRLAANGLRRIVVVSLNAHRPLAPRGERTRRLVEGLSSSWDVDLVAPSPSVATGGAAGRGRSSPYRRLAAAAAGLVLLDRWEPWSLQRLARWRPQYDAALLIGHPFSPPVYAARRLLRAGVPYVVDVGDPWALTSDDPPSKRPGAVRARNAERRLWRNAAGGIVTTGEQAARLRALFPHLRLLVRPNGYEAADGIGEPVRVRSRARSELRLAHFGMLSSARLDLHGHLRSLQESGLWERVVFAQFGDDFAGMLDDPPPNVIVERHPSYPWQKVLEIAPDYDAAMVVGHVSPATLPSKAVQYLTMPIPRIAVVHGSSANALSSYVEGRAGWLVVGATDPGAARLIETHIDRDWTSAELRAPAAESWESVIPSVVAFVEACAVGRAHPQRDGGASR